MAATLFAPGLLRGRRAIVTGGGTGIGLEIARQLYTLGASVAICGRRAEKLEEGRRAIEECASSSSSSQVVFAAPCDIRDYASVEHFVHDAARALSSHSDNDRSSSSSLSLSSSSPGIDILINNAGGQFPSPAEHISANAFAAVVRNNLLGTWNMTRAVAVNYMIPQRGGRIVNVIAQVFKGFPLMVHTGAARAGVDNMTKTLSVEWARFNIAVNAVAPGIITSSGTTQYSDALMAASLRTIPQRRFGTVGETAAVVVFLALPSLDASAPPSAHATSYVTGQTYYIDGGQSLFGGNDLGDAPEQLQAKL